MAVRSLDAEGRIDAKYQWNREKPTLLVFDVKETLIDLESTNPLFEKLFGDRRVLREWFGHLIMYSVTITLSGLYKDFFLLLKKRTDREPRQEGPVESQR